MKGIFSVFTDSAKELKSVRSLCVTGLLVALSMLIESFTIELPFAKINFAYLAIAAIGMLFGPVVSFFAGGLCDIVGFIVHPNGGFLPIYILIAMGQGLIYGLVLYRANAKRANFYPRVILARLLDVLIINLCLNTIANLHYGFIQADTVQAAIVARTAKNLLQFVADVPLSIAVLTAVQIAYSTIMVRTMHAKA